MEEQNAQEESVEHMDTAISPLKLSGFDLKKMQPKNNKKELNIENVEDKGKNNGAKSPNGFKLPRIAPKNNSIS